MMTFKITYNKPAPDHGYQGVAFCEGPTWEVAVQQFREEYAGKYFTIAKVMNVETGQYYH